VLTGASNIMIPFFHPEDSGALVWEPREPGDSWGDVQRDHEQWVQTVEKTYQDHQLSEHHEKVRTPERLCDSQEVEVRYWNIRDRMPPYTSDDSTPERWP